MDITAIITRNNAHGNHGLWIEYGYLSRVQHHAYPICTTCTLRGGYYLYPRRVLLEHDGKLQIPVMNVTGLITNCTSRDD